MNPDEKNKGIDEKDPFGKTSEEVVLHDKEKITLSCAELASVLDCSEEEVRSAVELESDSVEALRFLRSSKDPYVAIMGFFESRKRGALVGVFCTLVHAREGSLRERVLWTCHGSMGKDFSVNAQWESVRNAVLSFQKPSDPVADKRCSQVLDAHVTPTSVNLLSRSSKEKADFQDRIQEGFSSVFHMDCFVTVHVEGVSEERAAKVFSQINAGGEDPEEEKKISREHKLHTVACVPMVDPSGGKPVILLERGDKIEISFPPFSGLGRLISNYLGSVGERPVFTVLTKERLASGDYLVEVFISEGVRGIFKATPNLLLRQENGYKEKKRVMPTTLPLAKLKEWYILGVAFFLFLGVLYLAYFYLQL